jgi:hypothetical protein
MESLEFYSHLCPIDLTSYALASKDNYNSVQQVKEQPLFWKRRIEWYIRRTLPNDFVPQQGKALEYYRRLYGDYFAEDKKPNRYNILTLAETGRYEHLWLVSELYGIDSLDSVDAFGIFITVMEKNDSRTLELLLQITERYSEDVLLSVGFEHKSCAAIDMLFFRMKDYTIQTVELLINNSRVDYLKHIYESKPKWFQELHEEIVEYIANKIHSRADVLELYLSTNPQKKIRCSDYFYPMYFQIPRKEMEMIINSDVFIKDRFNAKYSAKVAYYIFEKVKLNEQQLTDVLEQMTRSATLLRKALSNVTVGRHYLSNISELSNENKHSLYSKALNRGNDSVKVLLEMLPLDRDSLLDILSNGIKRKENPRGILDISKYLKYTPNDVCYCFCDGTNLDYWLRLGVNINVIGDRFVTHSVKSLDKLIAKGYDVSLIARYLLQRLLNDKESFNIIKSFLCCVKNVNISGPIYSSKSNRKVDPLLRKELDKSGVKIICTDDRIKPEEVLLLSDEINWPCFRYIYELSSTDFPNGLLPEVKKKVITAIQTELLLCIDWHITEVLEEYLLVATDFSKRIKCKKYGDKLKVFIDDDISSCTTTCVIVSHKSYKGKYRALDIFCEDGSILTTVDEIKARRVELRKKLPIR